MGLSDGTLAGREVAAYLVSEATGWEVVPPTVLRTARSARAPASSGSTACDERRGRFRAGGGAADRWISVAAAQDDDGNPYLLAHSDTVGLARMALFDAVINNADRKGGHVLPTPDGHLYGIDHGVSFHVEDKLRTVLWGFLGRPIAPAEREALSALGRDLLGGFGQRLTAHISSDEVLAAAVRVERLLAAGVYPGPSDDWPAVPWPPF